MPSLGSLSPFLSLPLSVSLPLSLSVCFSVCLSCLLALISEVGIGNDLKLKCPSQPGREAARVAVPGTGRTGEPSCPRHRKTTVTSPLFPSSWPNGSPMSEFCRSFQRVPSTLQLGEKPYAKGAGGGKTCSSQESLTPPALGVRQHTHTQIWNNWLQIELGNQKSELLGICTFFVTPNQGYP